LCASGSSSIARAVATRKARRFRLRMFSFSEATWTWVAEMMAKVNWTRRQGYPCRRDLLRDRRRRTSADHR